MKPPPVGIDLGTTNSVIAACDKTGVPSILPNSEGEQFTPSVVAFEGAGMPFVGSQAATSYGFGLSAGVALFKRQMGRGGVLLHHEGHDYTAEGLSTLVLTKLADDAAESLGGRPTRAVVTVPAYFRNPEREATMAAVREAGLECLQLINEPTAAAVTFQRDMEAGHGRFLVYDLGGGTFDVTVLETGSLSEVLDSRGDPNLGGADWDQAMAEILYERVAEHFSSEVLENPAFDLVLRREAEGAKKRLTSMLKAQVALTYGSEVAKLEVTREEFELATEGLIRRTLDMTQEVLDALGVGTDGISAVLLVGGSTRMPMVDAALTRMFGQPTRRTLNPDAAVALGAAIKARQIADLESPTATGMRPLCTIGGADGIGPVITDITNFSLGVIAVSEDGARYVNQVMIPRGTKLPSDKVERFRHVFREGGGGGLELPVTQGEVSDPAGLGYLGFYTIDSLPGVRNGQPCEIEIGYSYNASGIGTARVRVVGSQDWTNMERREVPADVPERFAVAPPQPTSADPVTIMMFFDVSGSMSGSPIQDARTAALKFVSDLDLQRAHIGIGVVANKSMVILPPTQDHGAQINAISQVDVNAEGCGFGNDGHPFADVLSVMRYVSGPRTAVVLADGVWSNPSAAIKSAETCKAEGIDVIAIGFGDANKDFLDAISTSRELSIKTTQAGLVETFGTIAQVVSERSGLKSF